MSRISLCCFYGGRFAAPSLTGTDQRFSPTFSGSGEVHVLETRARVSHSLRHDPRATHTVVVAPLNGRPWSVFRLQGDAVLYEGPFVEAWNYAIELGRNEADQSLVVAVNNEGEIIAREVVDPIGAGQFASRPRGDRAGTDAKSGRAPDEPD
jgi:hypothetical protein